jgi:hypothetical protein
MNIFYDTTSFSEPTYCCICEGYMYFADTLVAVSCCTQHRMETRQTSGWIKLHK